MKRIKRIVAVIILLFVVLLVGYSCYTSSRLTGDSKGIDGYLNTTFYARDGGMLAFVDELAWYKGEEQRVVLLEIKSYDQGTIVMTKGDKEYVFTVIDDKALYDEQTKQILTKGERYG